MGHYSSVPDVLKQLPQIATYCGLLAIVTALCTMTLHKARK
jgi:hypothetical protein